MRKKLLCLFGHKWAYIEIMGKKVQRYCKHCHMTQYWDETTNRFILEKTLTKG
jgi:hypothetical protein